MSDSNDITNKQKLRIEFIGMMFALAIGQVGLEVGNVYEDGFLLKYPSFVTHLILATFIIASSWIGWQTSKAKGNFEPIIDVFGKSFFILLIDLFLVVCYFILVKGVEKPVNDNIIPSSNNEVIWSMWIFGAYFIWDILTKLIITEDSNQVKLKLDFQRFRKRGYQSVLCLLIILLGIFPSSKSHNEINVIAVDISLILVFWLFRGLKGYNSSLENSFRKKIILFSGIILPCVALALIISYCLIYY